MQQNETLHLSVDCVLFGYDDAGLKVLLINQKRTEPADSNVKPMSQLPGDLILLDEGAHRKFRTHLLCEFFQCR